MEVPRPLLGWAGSAFPPREDAPEGEREMNGIQHRTTEQAGRDIESPGRRELTKFCLKILSERFRFRLFAGVALFAHR